MPSSRNTRSPASWVHLARLGAELAAALVGFTLLGLWIDGHYGTGPWGLVVCLVIGAVGGFYNLIRSSSRALRSSSGELPDDEG